jgi:hypothetical protein
MKKKIQEDFKKMSLSVADGLKKMSYKTENICRYTTSSNKLHFTIYSVEGFGIAILKNE